MPKTSLKLKSFLAGFYSQNLRYFPVWFISIAGLSLSLIMTVFVARWERSRIWEQFDRRADNLAFALQQNLDDVSQVARSLSGFYKASDRVTSEEFREFSLQILRNTPGVLRVGYAPKISQAEREIYEREKSLTIWQGRDKKERKIAPKMPVYFPSAYLEPNDSLQSRLGYNHFAEWQRKAAIEKARDTSVLAIAPSFIPNISTHKEFIIYAPVYDRSGSVATREERKKSFSGVAYTVFQVENIVRTALKGINTNGLDLYLYEMPVDRLESALNKSLNSPKEHFLVAYDAQQEKFLQDAESAKIEQLLANSPQHRHCPYSRDWTVCIRTVNLEDREWSLLILPEVAFAGTFGKLSGTFAIGFLATGILVLYLFLSLKRSSQKEALLQALIASERQLKMQKANLEKTLEKLKQTQSQLVHTEKMSGLGQMVAGIAHEINNPIGFIYGNVDFALQYSQDIIKILNLYDRYHPNPHPEIQAEIENVELEYLLEDFPQILQSMQSGAQRIQEIVLSMRNFSRLDEAKMKFVDIHEGIDNTLTILQHRLKAKGIYPGIQAIRDYGDLPEIECNAGQLNQVFMNLIANAIDALREADDRDELTQSPQIAIRSRIEGDRHIAIEIADNGLGIPEHIQSKLFDPFFTTKAVGKGTGLGLSISYQIVTEFHNGQLECISEPGQGARFRILLPVVQNAVLSSTLEPVC
ncbi:MAG: CHASE domain-containing protein [Cyanobacteria bacterium SBLK]|nr:CHASE domain-containing protein [Cyanobacteria bacterium SBLK]